MRALISSKIRSRRLGDVGQCRLGVGVLGLEVGDGVGVVPVAEPGVLVDDLSPCTVRSVGTRLATGGTSRVDVGRPARRGGVALGLGHLVTLMGGDGNRIDWQSRTGSVTLLPIPWPAPRADNGQSQFRGGEGS